MKYAIDKPNYQQFYVRYNGYKEVALLKAVLDYLGFMVSNYIGTCDYSFSVVVVNYIDKLAFGTNAGNMACAMQCSASVLSVEQFINEIVLVNK